MTGLNLEPFLRLLRADLGVWLSLGAILLVLALMAWTSWGSRRALRKCLVLSILAHVGLLLYGGGWNTSASEGGDGTPTKERIQSIQVVGDDGTSPSDPSHSGDSAKSTAGLDRPGELSGVKDEPLRDVKPPPAAIPAAVRAAVDRVAAPPVSPPELAISDPSKPETSPSPDEPSATLAAAPARPDEIPPEDAVPAAPANRDAADSTPIRVRPDRPAVAPTSTSRVPKTVLADRPAMPAVDVPAPAPNPAPVDDPAVAAVADRPAPDRGLDEPVDVARGTGSPRSSDMPDGDLRSRARSGSGAAMSGRVRASQPPLTIARAVGTGPGSGGSPLPLPISRPIADVPEVYRERVAPDRPERAKRQGASDASEEAVERALVWLARHQDNDGRWNAGTVKKSQGNPSPLAGEHNFTSHCPPGDICAGECYYYEADTAMTGLALLAYLGAGYHHAQKDGKHAAVVDKGLRYLLSVQTPNGDLRGESRAVGMYCHAMATLALCEAFALSGDSELRDPAERAVAFLVKSRATDGMSWRYQPVTTTSGDTSLLGWAILAFKSADETGLAVPPSIRTGALSWLKLVSAGEQGGLSVYRPNEGPYGVGSKYVPGRNMTPTMTAEGWVCRQFLGVGGPSAASDEAARYLLENAPGRGKLNFYYWYYGTLAMRQRGGDDWARWNPLVRDELVALQKTRGHAAGSWDPADSRGPNGYDVKGGRIYCTALAAMTLEVYYRYGKLDNAAPTRMAPKPDPTLRRTDARKADR